MALQKIGSGSYSTVYGDTTRVYKILDRLPGEYPCVVLREGLSLRKKFGIPLKGLLLNEDKSLKGFCMERAFTKLNASYCETTKNMLCWIRDLLEILSKIHVAGIIHGDIKPDNILLQKNGRVTFCDFGLSIRSTEGQGIYNGIASAGEIFTMPYRSPELLRQTSSWCVLASSDIWSLGMSVFECVADEPPPWLSFKNSSSVLTRILSEFEENDLARKKYIQTRISPIFKDSFETYLVDFLVGALHPVESMRKSAFQLLEKMPQNLPLICHKNGLFRYTHLNVGFHEKNDIFYKFIDISEVEPTACLNKPPTDHTRDIARNVAKILLVDTSNEFFSAVQSLIHIFEKNEMSTSSTTKAVCASMMVLCLLKPAYGMRFDWLARLASTTTSNFIKIFDIYLVDAILYPEWSETFWPSVA